MPIPATILENKQEPPPSGYHLLVMGPDLFATHALPIAGALTIGRADTAEVRLTDPLASRQHARLHIGGTITIEDLGSANQTRVRDVPLRPGEPVPIAPGEAIAIGATILMVQHRNPVSRPRRILPHGYFEARVEEECVRSAMTRDPFAVVRLHVDGEAGISRAADVIAPALRLPDMLAVYGPGEYEILLASTPPELALAITDNLAVRLADAGITARTGIALYPRDGRTPEALVGVACERVRGSGTVAAPEGAPLITSPAMQKVLELAERAALGMISLLIVGETGVGKEVMAERVHRASPRAGKAFLCLNCASLSENLLESELFGHERGAFTGATEAKPGLLETAPGGTVFLDEIGEMPLGLQAKLLRVLEMRQVTRVGGLKPKAIDVRFLSATNRHLEEDVAAGRFRRDLYYRLNGMMLQIPPLRARRAEIAPLALLFLAHFNQQLGRRLVPVLRPDTLAILESHEWPGNIRELRNMMERALLLSTGGEILPEHLPLETMATSLLARSGAATPAVTLPVPWAGDGGGEAPPSRPARPTQPMAVPPELSRDPLETEREQILRALTDCAGSQTRAARALGIARSTLVLKIERLGIPRPRKNVPDPDN